MRRLLIVLALLPIVTLTPNAATPPRLLVIVVVDQMRADYLDRFARHWRHGFRTLLAGGRVFERAAYTYLNTSTCAGHTTIATGTLPRTHGMILNIWWDRTERRSVECTDDRDSPDVSYGRPGQLANSARRQLAPSLADELGAQQPGSRTVALSLKARSAIPLAGRTPDAVVWFDDAAGSFVTAKAFAAVPVSPVKAFLDASPFENDLGREWSLLGARDSYLHADAGVEERPPAPWTGLFPHKVSGPDAKPDATFFDLWQTSPFADSYLASMSLALADDFALGRRETTDVLAVSFSSLDEVGHDFGPHSREVEDLLRHLDVSLGRLIEGLDARVGRDRYVLALSADHGIPPVPIPGTTGRVVNEDIRERNEETLTAEFGPVATGSYVDAAPNGYVYLAPGVFDRLQAAPAAMRRVIQAVRQIPGVARVLRRDELSAASGDPIVQAAARGYHDDRSGDLIVVPRRGWFVNVRRATNATTHGSPYDYDTRVPVIFFGGAVTPGRSTAAASPADIAPTLAHLAGIRMPRAEGRQLPVTARPQ